MQYFLINKNLDTQVANDFIELCNKYPADDIKIYLTSNGGLMGCAYMMVDMICDDPDRFTIVAMESINSSAFLLFFSAPCKRILVPETLGTFHLTRKEIWMSDAGRPYYDDDHFYIEQTADRVRNHDAFCQMLGMLPGEMDTMVKCEEARFSTQRLQDMLRCSTDFLQVHKTVAAFTKWWNEETSFSQPMRPEERRYPAEGFAQVPGINLHELSADPFNLKDRDQAKVPASIKLDEHMFTIINEDDQQCESGVIGPNFFDPQKTSALRPTIDPITDLKKDAQ